jgi:hypothetical protein
LHCLTTTERLTPPIPRAASGRLVVPAPGEGPGYWAGGPSAVATDDAIYLAYRLRRPVGEGRGYANVIARSTDGETFETVLEISKHDFDSESLERPALAIAPDGRFHLYMSCATPGTLHWWVDALVADDPSGFDASKRISMLPGDEATAYKDPVVLYQDGRWHMWVCVHRIEEPADADRMYTAYATSDDGIHWGPLQTALVGRDGTWDQRGARVASVLMEPDHVVAYYDGRATAEQNWEEQTGLAFGHEPATLHAADDGPAAVSPDHGGGLRYASILRLDDGGFRLYYEATCRDGSHDLRTEYVPPVR